MVQVLLLTGPFRAPTGSAMVVNSLDFIEYSGGFRIGSVADDMKV